MSSCNTPTTSDDIRTSVSSIYSDLLRKRTIEREQKEEMERLKREEKKQRKEEKKAEKKENMSKEERRKAEVDTWKEIVVGLTGEDLDYVDDKKPKKKYRKWIDDDSVQNNIKADKVKKVKKRNYQKEFAPELNMLKNLVADQNRFSAELLKRYQNAAGPNTKDAAPPNKTIVELISTINASRANALGMLREIGNIKKTMADLYMKQRKLDADLHGSNNVSSEDLALMGSSIASSIFDDDIPSQTSYQQPYVAPSMMSPQQMATYQQPAPTQSAQPQQEEIHASTFDPSTWEGPALDENTQSVLYENIPHSTVVELNRRTGQSRFKVVRTDTGEELTGAPIPTVDPSRLSFNEKDMRVKGQFDEMYELQIIGG